MKVSPVQVYTATDWPALVIVRPCYHQEPINDLGDHQYTLSSRNQQYPQVFNVLLFSTKSFTFGYRLPLKILDIL